jgi:hypothetical protein
MIVLRLRVTDASETCNQLLGLKELPCFVIKSEAVLLESSSIPLSSLHVNFENLPSTYSDELSRIGKAIIPLEIVPSDSHPHQNKTPTQMKKQQLLHNQQQRT